MDKRKLKNPTTAGVYLGNYNRLLEALDLSTSDLLTMAREEPAQLEHRLIEWVNERRKEGRIDAYLGQILAALRSFFTHQKVAFDDWPDLKLLSAASLSNERVPTNQELALIGATLSLRFRTAAFLVAQTGIRLGVLCDNEARTNGAKALQLRHLPDLILKPTSHFVKVPFQIAVPEELSKTGKGYITFGGQEVAGLLLSHFKERRHLNPESYVITGERRDYLDVPITRATLSQALRLGMKKVMPEGVHWRPYVLRSYFSTQLYLAEGRGLITRDLREEMMGHTDVSSRYNVGKKWTEDMLREARETYSKCSPFLETNQQATAQAVTDVRQMNRTFIEGNPILRLLSSRQKERLVGLTPMELIKEVTQRMKPEPEVPRQKDFPNSDVPAMLAKGWTVAAPLGSDKMVLNAPGVGA